METELAIYEPKKTANGIFIDQDVIECARINSLIKRRIAKVEAEQRKADQHRRKAEKAAAKRRAYTIDTAKHILIDGGIIGAVTWAWMAGMIHPAICTPVCIFFLCAGCLRLGKWIGRVAKK